jgi:hypothetical protein
MLVAVMSELTVKRALHRANSNEITTAAVSVRWSCATTLRNCSAKMDQTPGGSTPAKHLHVLDHLRRRREEATDVARLSARGVI